MAANVLPNLLVMLSSRLSLIRRGVRSAAQLTREFLRHRETLLFAQMASDLDFAPMRTQREPAAAGITHHPGPVLAQFETRDACSIVNLYCHPAVSDRDPLVIRRVPLDVAEGKEKYGHFQTGVRQDGPRAENQEEARC